MSQKLITVEELGKWLGVAPSTIYGWQFRGEGPLSIKVGRLLRYREGDVEAWLRRQEVPARPAR